MNSQSIFSLITELVKKTKQALPRNQSIGWAQQRKGVELCSTLG